MEGNRVDVLGSGGRPAGYVGAIRAAQLGFKVACIEKRASLGGTCLNVGCIPSKSLLHSSEKYREAKEHLKDHGVEIQGVHLNLAQLMKRKDKIVTDLTTGINFLFRKNKVLRLQGTAKITSPSTVEVADGEGKKEVWLAKYILIATGSDVVPFPQTEIDEEQIISSVGALKLSKIPNHLVVMGGGYIGLEMGTVWQRLGARVTVVEYVDRLVPAMDREVSTHLQKALAKQGLTFRLGTKIVDIQKASGEVKLTLASAKEGDQKQEQLTCDVLLVSIGRRPYTEGLGLENIGLALDKKGCLKVNKNFETSVPGVYAVGDVIGGAMLAHKAEEEAIAAVEFMAGHKPHVNYEAIPAVIYTQPEVASVGHTEEELRAANIPYKAGKFPLSANSRARVNGEAEGFVKILAHQDTDRVLGVHIISPQAGTMIAEAVLGMEYGASSEDIARTCHAHPTLNEAVKEAALAVEGRAVHI